MKFLTDKEQHAGIVTRVFQLRGNINSIHARFRFTWNNLGPTNSQEFVLHSVTGFKGVGFVFAAEETLTAMNVVCINHKGVHPLDPIIMLYAGLVWC